MKAVVAALWVLLVANYKAFGGSSESLPEGDCVDKNTWCDSMKQFCEDQSKIMSKSCPKTCNICGTDSSVSEGFVRPGQDCNSLLCEHSCENAAHGPRCRCEDGYRLREDKRSCEDINECAHGNLCGEGRECVNTEGSYKCQEVCGPNEQKYYGRSGCCEIASGRCGKNSANGGFAASGKDAIVTRWPWMSLITVESQNKNCGGILISKSWVLAAAHCFDAAKPGEVHAYFGIISTDQQAGLKNYSQRRQVDKIVIHPEYEYPSHDVALVKVKREVEITDYVSIACLPSNERPPTGQQCFATGYAAIPRQGLVERWLQQERVTISDEKNCKFLHGRKALAGSAMCVSHEKRKTPEDCQGSTGGPLVCQRCSSCGWYVAGLASESVSCGVDKTYSSFTIVSLHEVWIQKSMGVPQIRANFGASCQKPGRVSGWSEWEVWSDCSSSCRGGTRIRTRKCENANRRDCIGLSKDIEKCNTHPCPKWGRWNKWGQCSVTCGKGRQTSSRTCQNGNAGDKGCKGKHTRRKHCKKPACPKWGQWSEWSTCSHTCGYGVSNSTRRCLFGKKMVVGCEGSVSRTKPCNLKECEGCLEWSAWSSCSASCGSGTRGRSRNCTVSGPIIAAQETEPCESKKCTALWSGWSEWSDCTASCGSGVISRVRICNDEQLGSCHGPATVQKKCNTVECPSWSKWGPWGLCDVKCGEGKRKRRRECQRDRCRGRPFEEERCIAEKCPKKEICSQYRDMMDLCYRSAHWCSIQPALLWGVCDKTCCLEQYRLTLTEWSSWSHCSATCDAGEQSRIRQCTIPQYCDNLNVDLEEKRQCEIEPCQARALMICSASCGGGITQRPCQEEECDGGEKFVVETCNTSPCLEKLLPWGEWGRCSMTCGVGTRERTRSCYGPETLCHGDNMAEVEKCQVAECEGVWSEWRAWSLCSTTCGLGTIERQRTCIRGNCVGPDFQEEICLTFECPAVSEASTCEDESSMRYICPLLASQYCNNNYTIYACRKTCGAC